MEVEIDDNRFISDLTEIEKDYYEITTTEVFGHDKIQKDEIGNNILFIWEFRGEFDFKREIRINTSYGNKKIIRQ